MDNSFKYKIIERLLTLPVCNVNSAKTEYTVRCPYCGDSRNSDHGHFSIHVDVDSDDPIMYRCLKCDVSGILNNNVLDELQLDIPVDIHDQLRNFNRKIIKKNKYVNNNNESFIVPMYKSTISNEKKLLYINTRLDTQFDYIQSHDLKVVFDLFEFLKFNEIKSIPGMNFNQLQILNDYYVGWLSTNNNCITFRRIVDSNKLKRYIKVIINPSNINGNTFYSIPNKIDLMYTNKINIHIAEGIFDITSVFANLQEMNLENNYFYASCGFGFLTIIRYLIYNGINTGLNIHIYSDNDKTDQDHINYLFRKSNVSSWSDHIYIHRNQFDHQKDYGVPKELIIDSKMKLK